MQPINEALSLMIVGMSTVFFILYLIVVIGNFLVRLTNKFIPEEVVKVKSPQRSEPSSNTYAAIASAIEIATQGKGKVINVKKIR